MGPFHASARALAPPRAGFTLVELMVVIAIVGIIAAILVVSQGEFNKTIILAESAYDVALSIRNAEVYGLGTVASAQPQQQFTTGYGVHFDKSLDSSFIFFADTNPASPPGGDCHPVPKINGVPDPSAPNAKPGDCIYTANNDQLVQTYTLNNGITIADFCVYDSDGTPSCAVSHGGDLTALDIVFARPNPDVFLSANSSWSSSVTYSQACIELTSPQGGERSVYVTEAGGIYASTAACPSP